MVESWWWPFIVLAVASFSYGCQSADPVGKELGPVPRVDGGQALGYVAQILDCGPRYSGSAGAACARARVRTVLEASGWLVEEWAWTQETPRGAVEMVNLGARLPGIPQGRPKVLLCGHYDTKSLDEYPEFLSANDGGSSTGLLMELGSVLAQHGSDLGLDVRILFFDGEECVTEYGPRDGLFGSRRFAQAAETAAWREGVLVALVLDMVGDAHLTVTLPRDTAGWLAKKVFAAAERAGVREAFGYAAGSILDDHVPLIQAGIAAVDIIDFHYGSRPGANDYWHTDQDTLDKLSAESLAAVGNVVLEMLWAGEVGLRPPP